MRRISMSSSNMTSPLPKRVEVTHHFLWRERQRSTLKDRRLINRSMVIRFEEMILMCCMHQLMWWMSRDGINRWLQTSKHSINEDCKVSLVTSQKLITWTIKSKTSMASLWDTTKTSSKFKRWMSSQTLRTLNKFKVEMKNIWLT